MTAAELKSLNRNDLTGDFATEDEQELARPARTSLLGFSVPNWLPVSSAALLAVVAITAIIRNNHSSSSRHVASSRGLLAGVCVASGEDCQKSHACCKASDKCYSKNKFWASCQSSCDAEVADELDGTKWACEVLSADGEATEAKEEAEDLPRCKNVSDAACLKAKCSVPGGSAAGDCSKTWCCQQPGTQCYKQSKYWSGCKQACPTKHWDCDELGPRTPGDPHTWKPCAQAKGAKRHPLLADGDVDKAWTAAEERASDLLKTLHLEDKVALLRGQNDPWPNDRHGYAGYVNPNFYFRNKCAMPLTLNDGPQGYNHYQKKLAGTTTQFPSLLAVAASFDTEVSRQYAEAIAEEFVAKGSNVMLGPDIEVGRNPLSGRSFETLSGEDPVLGAQLVVPFVQECLKRGIIVTVKHWLDNNEEDYRMTMNVNVSERAQHEIYMPVFKAAIDAGAGAVMCAYNKVNGTHACENEHLLQKLLRDDLGFRGFVMSDWGATHDAERSAKHGLDMEMPGGPDDEFHKLAELVGQGKISERLVDKMASHVLAAMFAVGHFDGQFNFSSTEAALDANVTSEKHRAVARRTIVESAVLLKNRNGTLPLQNKSAKIAMVGKYCNHTTEKSYGQGDAFSGGGSGWVQTNLAISPLAAMKARFTEAEITWSESASEAKAADVAVVCAAGHAEEGWDKANLTLPGAEAMVVALRKASPKQKIIVLAIIPGAVTTEWLDAADAALALFMPGEQVGPAVAALLEGESSPGGRLPVSLPRASEKRFTQQQYPGMPFNDVNMTADWSEDVLVGYRWNDARGKPSAIPFGFGLTYTTFDFRYFKVECTGPGKAVVSFHVVNTGKREGTAVPQLYTSFRGLLPVRRQLRHFRKVRLPPGGIAEVRAELSEEDWRSWSEDRQRWASAVDDGEVVTASVGMDSGTMVWNQAITCLSPADPSEIRVLQQSTGSTGFKIQYLSSEPLMA